jgi:hypothetical protein
MTYAVVVGVNDMSRCVPQLKINTHRTRDEMGVSAAVANGKLRQALFRPGTRALCKCAAGACDQSECNELWIFDEVGNKIACFYGTDFRAQDENNSVAGVSGLCIYRMPAQKKEEGNTTQDAVPPVSLNEQIAEVNRRNAEFWRTHGKQE